MKLYFTPRSHFSRKVRILLSAFGAPVELIDAGNVAERSPEAFGPNPLMKVPTLVDGETVVFDSDHIATYLTERLDPSDSFAVLSRDVATLNARAIMNGVMAAEVELILAQRTGIDIGAHRRFDKIFASIRRSLEWLEERRDIVPLEPSYLGFHLVCMWDHLALYDLVELPYPALSERVARISSIPYVASSAP